MRKIFLFVLFLLAVPLLYSHSIRAQELYIDEEGQTFVEWRGAVLGESLGESTNEESRFGSGNSTTNTDSTSLKNNDEDSDDEEDEAENETTFRDRVVEEQSLKRLEIE